MATSESPSSAKRSRREDFKEEFLTCSICSEPYDNVARQAKCLPCLHTYCRSCLQNHAGGKAKFDCPKCRGTVTLPDGKSVDSLPNNFMLDNLREYKDLFDSSMSCGRCDNPEACGAVSFCHDCSSFLCISCVDVHKSELPLQAHKLATLAELQRKKEPVTPPNQGSSKLCTKHGQYISFFCKSASCRLAVCETCRNEDHKCHDIVHMTAAMDDMAYDIQQLSAKLRKRNEEDVSHMRTSLQGMQLDLEERRKVMENQMQDAKAKLERRIDMLFHYGRIRSRYYKGLAEGRVEEKIKQADLISARISSVCESADQIGSGATTMRNTQPVELVDMHTQTLLRLQELENTSLPTSNTIGFRFTDGHHAAMTQIDEALCRDVWDIEITELISPAPQVDPSRCTIQVGLDGTDEFSNKATVHTKTKNGESLTVGGAEVTASEGGQMLQVTDNNDGTYSFEYYMLFNLQVSVNGTPLTCTPLTHH